MNLRALSVMGGAFFCGLSTNKPALAFCTRSSFRRTSSMVVGLVSAGGASLPYFHFRNFRPVTG